MAFLTFAQPEREDAPPIAGSATCAPEPHDRWGLDGARAILRSAARNRYEGLEETQLLSHAYLQELLAAHCLTAWAFHGCPTTDDPVAGTSDSPTQVAYFEIIAASGRTLTLAGECDWVAFDDAIQSIPLGAQVEFVSPSVSRAPTGIEAATRVFFCS